MPEEYPPENKAFVKENGIQHFQIHISPNKDPFVTIPPKDMAAALKILLDKRNHPLLIHCNKGKVSGPIGLIQVKSDLIVCTAPHRLCYWMLPQAPALEPYVHTC